MCHISTRASTDRAVRHCDAGAIYGHQQRADGKHPFRHVAARRHDPLGGHGAPECNSRKPRVLGFHSGARTYAVSAHRHCRNHDAA